mgnify:FL=1
MQRYAIWDKKSNIITPIGEVLTPEQWIERYPAAGLDTVTVVCSAGEINGAFFGTLGQMRGMYEKMGADFSECSTNEDVLSVIEAFEDSLSATNDMPSSEERIAAALEYQNLLSM